MCPRVMEVANRKTLEIKWIGKEQVILQAKAVYKIRTLKNIITVQLMIKIVSRQQIRINSYK